MAQVLSLLIDYSKQYYPSFRHFPMTKGSCYILEVKAIRPQTLSGKLKTYEPLKESAPETQKASYAL